MNCLGVYLIGYPFRMQPHRIDELHEWLRTPLGSRLYALECKQVSEALQQIFGWQLLQIGFWGEDDALLADARTQRKSVLGWHGQRFAGPASGAPGAVAHSAGKTTGTVTIIRSRTDSLAIAADSVDAVLLPHTLEYEPEPHEILREVGRVLSGEGHLIILGFRPRSSWGIRHAFARAGFPPGIERLIGERRLRDWLKLLGFEVVDEHRYLFSRPWGTVTSSPFIERMGERAWPLFASGYMIKARKRVYTLTPIRPRWRLPRQVVGGLIEPTTRRDWADSP